MCLGCETAIINVTALNINVVQPYADTPVIFTPMPDVDHSLLKELPSLLVILLEISTEIILFQEIISLNISC